jgi:hypothetical protein
MTHPLPAYHCRMDAKLLTRDGELVTEFGMPRFRITPPGATAYSFCASRLRRARGGRALGTEQLVPGRGLIDGLALYR